MWWCARAQKGRIILHCPASPTVIFLTIAVKKKVEDRSRWPVGLKRYSEGEYCLVCKGSGVVMRGGATPPAAPTARWAGGGSEEEEG